MKTDHANCGLGQCLGQLGARFDLAKRRKNTGMNIIKIGLKTKIKETDCLQVNWNPKMKSYITILNLNIKSRRFF